MSATVSLYKPVKCDVKFGKYYYVKDSEKRAIDIKYNDMISKYNSENLDALKEDEEKQSAIDNYYKDYYEIGFSENGVQQFTLYKNKTISGHRVRNKKTNSMIRHVKKYLKDYIKYSPDPGFAVPFVPVKEICYRQGWFFKKKFFKLSETYTYAFTKEDMIKKIHAYIEPDHWHDFDEYVEKFEDDMIFEISW